MGGKVGLSGESTPEKLFYYYYYFLRRERFECVDSGGKGASREEDVGFRGSTRSWGQWEESSAGLGDRSSPGRSAVKKRLPGRPRVG